MEIKKELQQQHPGLSDLLYALIINRTKQN